MNRKIFTLLLSIVAAGALLVPASRALADDESDEVQIEIKAPLDAVACDVAPQTIIVLGLTIDVTNAHIEVEDESGEDESGDDFSSASSSSGSDDDIDDDGDDDVDDDVDDDGENDAVPATCADLLVGSSVEVKLSSDVAPLVATEVEVEGDEDELEIKAPIQAIDTTLGTITVLGLPIDISSAEVEGCDDEDDDSNDQGIDPTTLLVGQFVEVELDRNALPALVATELEVKNFTNTVEIEVEDALGNDVDDVDDDGQPIPTVTVDVTQSVSSGASASSGKGSKGGSRTLHFRAQSNGRVTLHGLPTGRARVSVTRSVGGSNSSGRGSVTVAPNSTTSTTVQLKGSKSKLKSK